MKRPPERLRFVMQDADARRITNVWEVASANGLIGLGEIRWYAPWRRYVFYADPGRLFDAECLARITEFLVNETQERKAVRKAERRAVDKL